VTAFLPFLFCIFLQYLQLNAVCLGQKVNLFDKTVEKA